MMKTQLIATIAMLLLCPFLFGQVIITENEKGQQIKINVTQIPRGYRLEGIERGDGSFGDKKKEKHIYRIAPEKAYVYLTCNSTNSSNSGTPENKLSTALINKCDLQNTRLRVDSSVKCCEGDIAQDESILIKNIFNPVPEQDVVLMISYRNINNFPTDGALLLFFNEKYEKGDNSPFNAQKHFDFVETRAYFGEHSIENPEKSNEYSSLKHETGEYWVSTFPISSDITTSTSFNPQVVKAIIKKEKNNYRSIKAWSFSNLDSQEARNLFVTLKGTKQMANDPNRTITIKGVYIGADGKEVSFVQELVINTSHDPNRVGVNPGWQNYRRVDNKDEKRRLTYLVEFQNEGDGVAKNVYIKFPVPKALEAKSLKVINDNFRKLKGIKECNCVDSITTDTIYFHFDKILLPGVKQEHVRKRDTKGFLKFSLETTHQYKKRKGKKKPKVKILKKKKISAAPIIIFDGNKPITTNAAKSKFKWGVSPSIHFGYNHSSSKTTNDHYTIGISVSPYKTRLFPELGMFYTVSQSENSSILANDTTIIGGIGTIIKTFTENKANNLSFPLMGKINTKHLNLGVGVQLNIVRFSEKIPYTAVSNVSVNETGTIISSPFITNTNLALFPPNFGSPDDDNGTQLTTEFKFNLIGELGLGKVQKGPSVSIRGLFPPNDYKNYNLQLLTTWKF